jgi:hypothetical protein
MRIIYCFVFLSLFTAKVIAEPASQPIFSANDSWSYRLSVQNGGTNAESHITLSVMRVGSDGVVVTQKSDSNPTRQQSTMFGLDWSKRRSVNGQETTVVQPFSFPLETGKAWRTEYTEANPNPQKLRETDVYDFKVVGWEYITVPAGKFHALKVEANGRWTAVLRPRLLNGAIVARQGAVAAQTTENKVIPGARASGRYYKCFWYVPEVKRWVKSIEENYAADGSLSLLTSDELESYHVDGARKPESVTHDSALEKDHI